MQFLGQHVVVGSLKAEALAAKDGEAVDPVAGVPLVVTVAGEAVSFMLEGSDVTASVILADQEVDGITTHVLDGVLAAV